MTRSPPNLHTVTLVLLLLTIPGAALYGYAVARCWEWFAAPAVGVHLAWWQAAGPADTDTDTDTDTDLAPHPSRSTSRACCGTSARRS